MELSRNARSPYSKQSECQLTIVSRFCCLLAKLAGVKNGSVDLCI